MVVTWTVIIEVVIRGEVVIEVFARGEVMGEIGKGGVKFFTLCCLPICFHQVPGRQTENLSR